MSPQLQLNTKEQKQFTLLLESYETKKLSEGRKIADQLLKKYPDHGETMAMKGLIMIHLGERAAGIALAKEGLRKDLQSHVCWHVWGLVQKGERNYDESLKAYLHALRLTEAFNVMREASVLQTHLRQYDALLETRLNMLRSRPTGRANWLGVAVAYRLNNNLQEAKRVLENIEEFLRHVPARDAQYGEFVFFHLRVLEDLGELQEALSLLENKTKDNLLADRKGIVEWRTRLFSKLKSTAEADSAQVAHWTHAAEESWKELIQANSENHDYYKGFLTNAGIDLANLTDESRTNAVEILKDFSCEYSEATAPRRLALTIAQGETFKELVKPYLKRALQKGFPSLFSDVKNLYIDSDKLQTIQDIVEDIRERVSSPESPVPTDYLWTLYFLAQHYSFIGQQQKALEMLGIAMEHTPTLPELYMMKARVLKRVGDPYGAVRAMDDSRKLDGQDRFLNNKSGKYLLRAGMIAEADEVLSLFTKKDMRPCADLLDVQALFYLRELGDAQRRLGKYNLALKVYYNIQKVFTSFRDEQYDFHLYSVRRAALMSYFDMLSWEDNLHSHPAYIHAVVWIARIWIKLYDDPSLTKSLQPPELSGELSKKALNKAKKAAHKAIAATSQDGNANRSKASGKQNEDKGLDAPPINDEDPEGLELVSAKDPLERASQLLSTLEVFGKDNVDVNATLFDVAIRQRKYMKAARALRRAYARDPQHPEVHVRIVQFAQAVTSIGNSASEEMVKSVVEEALSVMKSVEVSLERFNSEYLQLHSKSALAVLACAKVSQFLAAPREEVENLLFTTLTEGVQLRLADALDILEYLRQIQSPRANEYRIACDKNFVSSNVFKSAEEQAVLRRQCMDVGDETENEIVF